MYDLQQLSFLLGKLSKKIGLDKAFKNCRRSLSLNPNEIAVHVQLKNKSPQKGNNIVHYCKHTCTIPHCGPFSRRLDMTNTVVRQVVESTQQSISLCLVKDLYLVQKDAEIKRVKTVDEDLDVNEKVRFVCYSES